MASMNSRNMIPGNIHRFHLHRKSNASLRLIREFRVARRQKILRRMFSTVDGDKSLNAHCVRESMGNQFSGKETLSVNESNSKRSKFRTNLFTASSPPATSSVSDQHTDDDKPGGKSSGDDDAYVVENLINRSTDTFAHGVISLMGRRREMEDAVTALPILDSASSHGFFAVYDGHGGFGVAAKCRERLHHLVAEEIVGDQNKENNLIDWERVMRLSFARMDREVCEDEGGEVVSAGGEKQKVEGKTTGSTAVVAVVGAAEIVIANCGDSRAVLCRGGVAVPLSRDHKPERPDERERVEAAGGSVVNWHGPRVLGVLATSRSIGDHCMRPYVISVPEVTVYRRSQSDEFLILASDGLWDVVSNDMACELVKRCLLHEKCRRKRKEEANYYEGYVNHVATLLAEMAISRGSDDNVSIIVVMLTRQVYT